MKENQITFVVLRLYHFINVFMDSKLHFLPIWKPCIKPNTTHWTFKYGLTTWIQERKCECSLPVRNSCQWCEYFYCVVALPPSCRPSLYRIVYIILYLHCCICCWLFVQCVCQIEAWVCISKCPCGSVTVSGQPKFYLSLIARSLLFVFASFGCQCSCIVTKSLEQSVKCVLNRWKTIANLLIET